MGEINANYKTNAQQDTGEFINYVVTNCSILRKLTESSVLVKYKCLSCQKTVNDELTRYIVFENLSGGSILKIFSNTERTFPIFLNHCTDCKMETHHERTEKLLMLPDVLVVNLERFQRTRSNRASSKNCKNVEPSIVLSVNETEYSLTSVITHYGVSANKGHYINTLYQNQNWIDCDDEVVQSADDVPRMGYLFFYDS